MAVPEGWHGEALQASSVDVLLLICWPIAFSVSSLQECMSGRVWSVQYGGVLAKSQPPRPKSPMRL